LRWGGRGKKFKERGKKKRKGSTQGKKIGPVLDNPSHWATFTLGTQNVQEKSKGAMKTAIVLGGASEEQP